MTGEDSTNCFERQASLRDDWLNGRIPVCACSFELVRAQAVVRRHRMGSAIVRKLGGSIVEVWADSVPPRPQGTLADLDARRGSPIQRLRSRDVLDFAKWIVRQSTDSDAPLRETVAEYGIPVFVSIAMLAVASTAATAPAPAGMDGELPLHMSWALLLLAAHYHRCTSDALLDVVKHERNLVTAEKKAAVAKRLGKYADVQARAVELARSGDYPSIRKAAEAVLPKIRADAVREGWFTKGSERDSNMNTLYRHLRKALGVLKANQRPK